ncbi:MAG: response regulator, partial [Bacteroidota bacterium]
LYNFQDRIDLVDSMDTQEEKSFYQNLQTQREVYIREQEIKSQAAQLHLLEDKVSLENRWKWTLGIASIILFLGGILYFQRYKRSQKLAKDLEFQNELILNQKAEIEAMDKVKTRFFTNISHEFRTPLNLILGPLRDKQGPIPPMELGMMQRNAERLLRLINQMLDLSKLEVGEMQMHYENTDIYAFLQELAEAFQSQADLKSIQYHIDIPPGNKLMQVDVEKLEHIIYNLLSNAFKFTPQGGKVGFYAALEPNNQLRMAVSDSGLGIPQHLQGKIFERFYQVDGSTTRAFEGTGIGLSLTKELTELYGGSIQLESEENRGCRFTLLLPLLPYDPKLELEKSMQLSAPISESPFASSAIEEQIPPTEDMIQILLVEDHQELRQYLKKQLGEQYRSMEAANGKDGLDTAKEKLPDVIISDVMMPEMDGIEMTQHLKNDPLTSHIPIILLTAKDDPNTRREGFDLGADQYLSKPFDTQELHARIKSVVQQSQRLQEKYSKSIFLKPTELEIEDHEARFLERAMEVVENHMDDSEFSVSDMQEEIGMSRMQLHRKLKALSGKSSSEFIRYIRLQRAAELLKHPGSQVADVAYRVGFNHLSYFAKCFKEEFGSVPSVYKESHA